MSSRGADARTGVGVLLPFGWGCGGRGQAGVGPGGARRGADGVPWFVAGAPARCFGMEGAQQSSAII